MRKMLLVVLFAIALPFAARADSMNLYITGGTFNYSLHSATFVANLGNSQGTLSVVFPSFDLKATSGTFGTGGSITWINNGQTLFSSAFTSGTWVKNSILGFQEFQFTGLAEGRHGQLAFLLAETTPITFSNCDEHGQ